MQSAHGTLVAATVSTESFTVKNADEIVVHIVDESTGSIYFTVDGSTPAVAGAGTMVVHSGLPARTVRVPTTDAQEVKLISAGTPKYSVEVFE